MTDHKPCGEPLCCRGLPIRVATAIGLVVKGQKMTGTKTYIVAALMAVYAIGGYLLGLHGTDVMMNTLLTAAGIAGLRHSNTTEVEKLANQLKQ